MSNLDLFPPIIQIETQHLPLHLNPTKIKDIEVQITYKTIRKNAQVGTIRIEVEEDHHLEGTTNSRLNSKVGIEINKEDIKGEMMVEI